RFAEFLGTSLREAIRAARSNSARYPGTPDQVQDEHRAVFEAVAAGDPKAAGKAMRRHIENAMRRLGLDIEEKLEE
ncbi:MAG: FCD domain-containing protein, partial [Oceanibaculum nanhaiense]|nr:FCD domain-containing protein [Oceanibaculum nanhaiense]